ncbi:hypothetical protein CLAIMM_03053 [Cladophialophora immunda]|nr:hypothetical protein CLAIMM_03053 [Cladophialophora immunda]
MTATRKLRNRLSQQAFRERQAMYVMELEKRLQNAQKTESARMRELEAENHALRDQLLDSRKRLRSIQAALEGVSTSITGALFDQRSARNSAEPEHFNESSRLDTNIVAESDAYDKIMCNSLNPLPAPAVLPTHMDGGMVNTSQAGHESQPGRAPSEVATDEAVLSRMLINPSKASIDLPNDGVFSSIELSEPCPSWLPVDTISMGTSFNEGNVVPRTQLSTPKGILFGTNSLFSAHILVFESCLKQKWDESRPLLNHSMQRLRSATELMMSTFVSMAWSNMTAWHTYTRAHIHIARLIMWRLNPNQMTYDNLTTCYRPTRLQLSTYHAAIIDWIPFPSLRDRVLLGYSNSPDLDQVICDIGTSYVVEGDLSKLIQDLSPRPGYVGVWDLVSVIAPSREGYSNLSQELKSLFSRLNGDTALEHFPEDVGLNANEQVWLPAPSAASLFKSPEYALQAFKLLGAHNGASTFRIDPAFFEKYPELYDAQADITAKGTHLKPLERSQMPMPVAMTTSVLQRYHDLATWVFDIALESL